MCRQLDAAFTVMLVPSLSMLLPILSIPDGLGRWMTHTHYCCRLGENVDCWFLLFPFPSNPWLLELLVFCNQSQLGLSFEVRVLGVYQPLGGFSPLSSALFSPLSCDEKRCGRLAVRCLFAALGLGCELHSRLRPT